MKLVKGSIILLILLVSLQICFGQDKSAASLVDRFGDLACEDIRVRTDTLLQELLEDPKAQGYVVIYPEKNSLTQGLKFERIINTNVYLRNFDKKRIRVVRSKALDEAMVEFWKVPLEAEKPSFVEAKWIETPITKSFIFGVESADSTCPTFIPENYANLIKSNLNLRGNIVIFNNSKKEAQSKMEELLKLFVKDYKVPRKQIRIIFGKSRNDSYEEFWVIPRK